MNWWQKNPNPHEIVVKTINAILDRQSLQQTLDDRHLKLYSGHPIYSVFGLMTDQALYNDNMIINIVQMTIEALLSKVTKNQPRATFLTDNGDWIAQTKAEGLDKFVYGQFWKSKTYEETKKACLDCFIWGDGLIKTYSKDVNKKPIIQTKRTPTPFVITDERQAINSDPYTQYQYEFVDREVLKQRFPKFSQEIAESKSSALNYFQDLLIDSNLVLLIEAWRVADEDGKNGMHFVGTNNCTFLYEEYTRGYLPFTRLRYQANPLGYRSKGICQLLTGHQVELNRAISRLQDSFRLSAPKWLYEFGSKIVKTHFNNLAGGLVGYSGTPPQYYAPSAVPPQHFDYIMFIIQKSLEEVGLNQLTVTGTKPSGLNSGAALREHNDIETERFSSFLRDWETFHVSIALKIIKEAKYLAESKRPIEVRAPEGDAVKIIKWKDVDIDLDSFIMKPYPASMIPKQPFGRLEFIQDLINMEMLDPAEGMMLLDFPDTKAVTTRKYAARKDIEATVATMIEKGEYYPPIEFQDLEFGIQFCQFSYLYYKNRNCPQDKLDLLDQWINDALLILNPPQPTQIETGVDMGAEMMIDDPNMEESFDPEQMIGEQMTEMPADLSGEEIDQVNQLI